MANFLFLFIFLFIQAHILSAATHSGEISLIQEYFPHKGSGNEQKHYYTFLGINPKSKLSDLPGNGSFQFAGYLNLDILNSKIRNGDIKELSYTTFDKDFEVKFGISEVFWGKTESFNPIDVINQRDISEDVTFKKKLGQPLVRFGLNQDFGLFEIYWLPYFRSRRFPEIINRLHTPYWVDWDNPIYESKNKDWHNFALRGLHYFSNGEVAFHVFSGTSREPDFKFSDKTNSKFIPIYNDMQQFGVEGEYIINGLRLKTEFAYRHFSQEEYLTSVSGLEYSIYNLNSTKSSITFLLEYLNDGRQAPPLFQNDIFFGMRFLVNDVSDTQISLGTFYDLEEPEYIISIIGSRKLYSDIILSVNANLYQSIQGSTPLSNLDSEDYIKVGLHYYY